MSYPLNTTKFSYLYFWHVMTELQNSLCTYEVGVNCRLQTRVEIDGSCNVEHHRYIVCEDMTVLFAESKSWLRNIPAYGNYFALRFLSVLGK